MDAPKIQISQLLSETTKDCDNIVITVLCLSVTKEIPSPRNFYAPFMREVLCAVSKKTVLVL